LGNQTVRLAVVLAIVLAISLYRNFERGRELDLICALLASHDVSVTPARRQAVDNICVARESANALESADP
jgi:hypothetical protein